MLSLYCYVLLSMQYHLGALRSFVSVVFCPTSDKHGMSAEEMTRFWLPTAAISGLLSPGLPYISFLSSCSLSPFDLCALGSVTLEARLHDCHSRAVKWRLYGCDLPFRAGTEHQRCSTSRLWATRWLRFKLRVAPAGLLAYAFSRV